MQQRSRREPVPVKAGSESSMSLSSAMDAATLRSSSDAAANAAVVSAATSLYTTQPDNENAASALDKIRHDMYTV